MPYGMGTGEVAFSPAFCAPCCKNLLVSIRIKSITRSMAETKKKVHETTMRSDLRTREEKGASSWIKGRNSACVGLILPRAMESLPEVEVQ